MDEHCNIVLHVAHASTIARATQWLSSLSLAHHAQKFVEHGLADLGRVTNTLRKLLDRQSAVSAVAARGVGGASVGRRCRLLLDALGLSSEEQEAFWGKVTMQFKDALTVTELTHFQVRGEGIRKEKW